MKLFSFCIFFLLNNILSAKEYFYLSNVDKCTIKAVKNGKLVSVAKNSLANIPLEMKQLPRHQRFLSFQINNQVYLTSSQCVYLADDDRPEIKNISNNYNDSEVSFNELVADSNESDFHLNQSSSHEEVLNDNKYFLEFNAGQSAIPNQNVSSVNYNNLFPTDPSNPTVWNAVGTSPYKPKYVIDLEFGDRITKNGFLDFKIRLMKGTKVDTLSLSNVGSSSTLGDNYNWTYSEALTNYYAGYKYLFPNNSVWRPSIAGFIGLSTAKTIIANETTSYNFSSLGLGILSEAGMEYFINTGSAINFNFAYEYLAGRTLKSEHSDGSSSSSPININFSNFSLSLGLKTYF